MKQPSSPLYALKVRLAELEDRIQKLEDSEAHTLAIIQHMQKHRIRRYLKAKLTTRRISND